MSASNKPQPPVPASLALLPPDAAAAAEAMWQGSLGCTVRCVPTRRTVMCGDGRARWFGKWRIGERRRAAAEWHWLHVLPLLGIPVPTPVVWLGSGRRSLLVTAALPGRPMDAWIVDAAAAGWLPAFVAYACRRVAPLVRRLHDHRLVHRDLYWNHLMAGDPRRDGPVACLDVERVVRPRLRWHRWVVKDLAGLLASCPVPVAPRDGLRFLRAYLGGPLREHRATIAAVVRKAARIRGHVPRFG